MQVSRETSPLRSPWWQIGLILLSLVCYWPNLRGGLVWDDAAHVTSPPLQSVSGLGRIWSDPRATQQYYPLLHSFFWVEHRVWGDATLGYHLVNVLEHAAAACLLVVILRRLSMPGAGLTGVVFAVHPVCAESVAWISEQKNTLSLVFYLAAALAYLRFDASRGRPAAARAYALATLLFVAALLTKSVTATLPAAILVVFWWQRGRIAWRRDVVPLVPWFAVAIASGLFTMHVERTLIGAQGSNFDLTFPQRLLLAGRVVWFYLGKILWPSDLMFIYPHWDVRSAAHGWIVFLAAGILATVGLWVLRRRFRGPLAAWLFFVGSLFPALGFFNVYPFIFSYVANHFQYLASMGIFAAISSGAVALLGRAAGPSRALGRIAIGVVVAVLVLVTRAQSRTYVDGKTLYETTLRQNPECWMAHNNLGLWYERDGDTVRAMAEYEAALRQNSENETAQNNLGGILRRIPGRRDEAFGHLSEAVRLAPENADAHNNLGVWYEDGGELAKAADQFELALRSKPDDPEAHSNLGSVLARSPGRLDDAIAQLREAVRLQPDFGVARLNLGNALLAAPGRLDEAIAAYQSAVRISPDMAEAHIYLGNAWARAPGHGDDAIAEFRRAIVLKPDNGEAHNNLGLALSGEGRSVEAIEQFEIALRLMPDYPEIRFNIAIALLKEGGHERDAAAQLEALLLERPGNDRARDLLSRIREHLQ
jgi:tetratricopeptide (TPR) repeat protein